MRIKNLLCSVLLVMVLGSLSAQKGLYTGSPEFESQIENYIRFTVPVIGVDDLTSHTDDYIILDIREKEEFEISHIPGAIHMGYEHPDWTKVKEISKDAKIIVYCSIGYRSEKIGEKLSKDGFQNVYNLFGSIFEWANQGNALVDIKNNPTNHLHTYNKEWSKWVRNPSIEKVW